MAVNYNKDIFKLSYMVKCILGCGKIVNCKEFHSISDHKNRLSKCNN